MGTVIVYPSIQGEMYYIIFTQVGPDEIENLIVFAGRYLSITKLNYCMLTTLFSAVSWARN